MKEAVMIALGMAVGCFVISMGVVIFIASRLSKPLTALKDQMENTGLENLDAELAVPDTDDEVQAVGIAYQNLMRRLNESIVKENECLFCSFRLSLIPFRLRLIRIFSIMY